MRKAPTRPPRFTPTVEPAPPGSRRRLRAAVDTGCAAGSSGMAGGGGETAYPVRKTPGLTAGRERERERERVRAFRFGHRLEAVAVAASRLPDLGKGAVGQGLLPAHVEGQDQPRSPGRGGASS